MDKHDRFIAINQTLPGLEEFLKVVLGSEPLSEEANRQRIEFLRRLESVSRPPSLPPRPANLSELYRARIKQQSDEGNSGSLVQDESDLYKNDRTVDPVEFASKQREISRVATLYKTYAPPQTVVFGEKGSQNGGLYFPRPGNTAFPRDTTIRDSIQSTSSTEDDIYEHLSLKSTSPPVTPHGGETDIRNEDSFAFPSPPKTPLEHTGTGIYVGARPGSFRASGGKGKLPTGWFKREAKVYEEVYVSNLREPVIKGYLKDTKANKRRWCVLQGNRLHIFKTQEDPAMMIINLLGCDIAVDDKKKISYSFRLMPKEGPGISLAIEDGQDLSPWMSAIMAAVVRRGSVDRPNSPLEGAYTIEQARAERIHGTEVDGGMEKEDEDVENFYELPVDNIETGLPVAHSTPTPMESDDEEDQGYDAPLPPLPIIDDYSSSESSSDEDDSIEGKGPSEKAAAKKKIYDAIPADLLAELTAAKHTVFTAANKSQDSICEEGSINDRSLDLADSHSEHSGNISNRHSYSEPLASDDTGSSEPKEEKTDSLSRKRTSTVLSVSMDSVCSDTEEMRSRSLTSETSIASKGSGPKVKRRRKLVPAEAELQFLQDPSAMHSGILYQKRRLGVWSKRYCKIIDSRFKCYRNPADQKPALDFPILGYDISLIDSKDAKKSYCIKISHPSQEAHYFATDSRVSIERWIEVLSLAATGRLDVIAPYPPYFCAEQSGDELKVGSRESLLSSEGRLSDDDSADTLDDLDPPSERDDTLKRLQASEEQSSLPADESIGSFLPNDASFRDEKSSFSVQTQTNSQEDGVRQSSGGVKERIHKKRKEKPSDKEGTKTPSTMSPPHSMFISESVDGQARPEPMDQETVSHPQASAKESEDSSSKKDKPRLETVKKKKVTRGLSYDYRLRGNMVSTNLPENAKNKHQSMRRKNSQTFAHLVTLFDKEGRFCGYLTEVKYNKFGTTHLRRWCVVKNGVLILYNSESEETPQGKLSLVDMWLTDKSDESRNKFAFTLEDKEGKETILQTTVKEDFQKWMGVLELFTELRVERPTPEITDPLKKSDSCGGEEAEGTFERGTFRSKSVRAANKLKDEIYALAPGKVRSSLRMKLSQRVSVRDIFRKTHNSYDLEWTPSEGPSALPNTDVDTLAVFGGFLTQIEPNASTTDNGKSRWCTIKEKELLVFPDRKATDPVQKIPLLGSVFTDLSDNESKLNRFQIRHGNESIMFDAWDKFDLNRWLQMLASVTEHRNSSDDERPKCVGRLTSPTFTKKKMHRRTRSEVLQEEEDKPTSTTQWYTKTRDGSSSSTDRLMSGYLQEVREAHGARTLLRRWCVATSEKFSVYDNQNSKKASFEWELSEMEVQDQSDMDAGTFGFCVLLGEERLCFKAIDEDSARHWLSVLARYCQPVPANQPLFKPPGKFRSSFKGERLRSSSDNDLKAAKCAEKEANVLEVLSEGRASGRKLLRRATEDSTFFRRFNRSETFKAPWRASSEKLEVKMRERSGRAAANKAFKRFSCGSLFDSEGKYSGHLMELITSELYSSQVRRWCLQKDDFLFVYENEAAENPVKVIPLFDAKVVDTSDLEACVYRFRIDYGEDKSVFFRALTRTDLEKWTTVISVKTAVLQDRSERQLRRSRTLSLEKSTGDVSVSSESDVTSPDLQPVRHVTVDSASLQETLSICSRDSVFMRGISAEEETGVAGSAGLKPVEQLGETGSCTIEPKDEPAAIDEREDATSEKTFSESENSDKNVKRVNRLSSIEDLSHIYENFLAFASAMAESSPKFQEQLYHVYENVTQAFDSRSPNTAQKEGQLSEEHPGTSTDQETDIRNELGSPSMEMSTEFEKISLREKEDRCSTYRYSGICGESELEKLEEIVSDKERRVVNTLVEDENENNPADALLRGSLTGATDHASVTDLSKLEGESLDVSSGNKEVLLNNTVAGEILSGENEDSVNASQVSELQSQCDEEMNESATDVVESNCQTPLLDEDAQENREDVSNTVQKAPALAHADYVSAIETRASSFYLVQEISDQVWREIDGDVPSEPVIETNVQVSTTAESATDRDLSASVVFEPTANDDDDDEGIAADVEGQEPTVQAIQDSDRVDFTVANDDISNVEQPCFIVVQEANVVTSDEAGGLGNDFESQFSDAKTNADLKNNTANSESQDLCEDATPLEKENIGSEDAGRTEESSLPSVSYEGGDIEADDDSRELPVSEENLVKGDQTSRSYFCSCGVIQNVCAAESFDTSVLHMSTCCREVEVRCEQALLSAVSESENAQVWEEAVTRVDESASLTTQELNQETQSLTESLSPELEKGDSTFAGDVPDVLSCNKTEQEATELTENDKPVLRQPSHQTDSRPEPKVTEERNPTNLTQVEQNSADSSFGVSSEHAEKFQSTDTKSFSQDSSLDDDSLKANFSPQQDTDESERSPEQGLTKCSSDEEYFTPEGTIELSEENDNDTLRDFTETNSVDSTALNNNRGLDYETGETDSAEPVNILQSEIQDKTVSTQEESDDLQKECVPTSEPEAGVDVKNSQSDPRDTWSNSSNLEAKQELTKSQMDILKAVTAAFEEILELHGDDSDTDDTRL